MTAADARLIWIEEPPGLTVVAVDTGRVLGMGKMGPNRPGPGAHVATASFMVAADARGGGVGTALCRFALEWGRQRGYAGMQFNAVVETNRSAVELYRRLGFEVVGTVPGAFAHPTLGRVGLHVHAKYVFLDAKVEKLRDGGRVVRKALVIAHGMLRPAGARSSSSMSARPRPKRS